mmetsp:Transcript_71964/g.204202  ORF Transcript_71964/g.204202 Transcript_71964/m.204202 type:complete len:212 (+) Transcript_71964:452-1087(+)
MAVGWQHPERPRDAKGLSQDNLPTEADGRAEHQQQSRHCSHGQGCSKRDGSCRRPAGWRCLGAGQRPQQAELRRRQEHWGRDCDAVELRRRAARGLADGEQAAEGAQRQHGVRRDDGAGRLQLLDRPQQRGAHQARSYGPRGGQEFCARGSGGGPLRHKQLVTRSAAQVTTALCLLLQTQEVDVESVPQIGFKPLLKLDSSSSPIVQSFRP